MVWDTSERSNLQYDAQTTSQRPKRDRLEIDYSQIFLFAGWKALGSLFSQQRRICFSGLELQVQGLFRLHHLHLRARLHRRHNETLLQAVQRWLLAWIYPKSFVLAKARFRTERLQRMIPAITLLSKVKEVCRGFIKETSAGFVRYKIIHTHGRRKGCRYFEIRHFPIKFFAKKGCFLSFGVGEMKFCHFWPPLQKSFWPPLENPPLAPPWKNPSDIHVRIQTQKTENRFI